MTHEKDNDDIARADRILRDTSEDRSNIAKNSEKLEKDRPPADYRPDARYLLSEAIEGEPGIAEEIIQHRRDAMTEEDSTSLGTDDDPRGGA